MQDAVFLVQPYVAKATRLVGQPAQLFAEEASARRAASRLARFRAGVVVMSQSPASLDGQREPPEVLAIHGNVPASWTEMRRAA